MAEIGSQIEYSFLDITITHKRRLLLDSLYRLNSNSNFDPFISILEEISFQFDDIIIIGDLNNNLLRDNALMASMSFLRLYPVNVSTTCLR